MIKFIIYATAVTLLTTWANWSVFFDGSGSSPRGSTWSSSTGGGGGSFGGGSGGGGHK